MVDWHRFDPGEWEIEYDSDKLAAHQIGEWEAAEFSGMGSSSGKTAGNMALIGINCSDVRMLVGR